MTVLEWVSANWLTVLGGGSISGVIGYFLGGKQKQEQDLKKSNVEIEISEIDYAVKVRELYDSLLTQSNIDKENFRTDRDTIALEFKNEREYFRSRIDDVDKKYILLQEQFNTIQLAYAKEVEQSQNWEKLHRELTDKYNALEKAHEDLKVFCEKIKLELDKYKKIHK
jgi:hypothetical protein